MFQLEAVLKPIYNVWVLKLPLGSMKPCRKIFLEDPKPQPQKIGFNLTGYYDADVINVYPINCGATMQINHCEFYVHGWFQLDYPEFERLKFKAITGEFNTILKKN